MSGFQTLLQKEVRRFLKVPGQTLVSPLITTTLYFLVFGYTLGSRLGDVHGVTYARFIVPGLVMLGVVSNSFLNTASSLFVQKTMGTIVDLLVAPIPYAHQLAAFVLGGVVRGLVVGGSMWVVAGLFTTFEVVHPLWALAYLLLTATFFAGAGLLVAVWAESFEQINLVPTFVITPLTFLGGVFYSVDRLPSPWRELVLANPIVYMVEGLRYGVLGASDLSPWMGLLALVVLDAVVLGIGYRWLAVGYRLRS